MVYVYYYILLIPEFRSVNLCISILQPGFQYPRAYTGVGGGAVRDKCPTQDFKNPISPKVLQKKLCSPYIPAYSTIFPLPLRNYFPFQIKYCFLFFPHQFNVTILFSETFIQGVPINMEFSDEFDIVFMNNSLIQFSDTYLESCNS